MAKYLRYAGEFLSHAGITWRVEILQEAGQPFASVGALTFEADEPLLIEWKKTDKEEVLCGSTATIRVESPGDRTYEDLYAIEVGKIRMDVYRAGLLYWSGALDPEFYEEPYERASKYPVSFTFSDFGILDRLKYNLSGMQTLYAILTDALGRSTISYTSIDQSLISSYLDSSKLTLGALRVRSDNFYDEDGEATTLKETLEGILLPLGLRLVQRNGRIWVYDLNGAYTLGQQMRVEWNGASQTMGTDKVANNVKITWNTYAQGGNQAPTDCWTQDVDKNLININSLDTRSYGGSEYISFHYSTDLHDWIDATDAGFTLWLSSQGKNAEIGPNSKAKFYKIVEQNDGTESEGVAVYYVSCQGYAVGDDNNGSANIRYRGNLEGQLPGKLSSCGKKLFKSAEIWLPPVDSAGDLLLRVGLNALIDCRFNPFEQAAKLVKGIKGGWFTPDIPGVEQDQWEKTWKSSGTFVYVPVTIKFQPDGSNTVYVWDNRDVVARDVNSNPVTTLSQTYGSWKVYQSNDDENPPIWGYLCWYNPDDRLNDCGVLGWKKNHPALNPHNKNVTTILRKAEDGQFIPYPGSTRGGKLWLEVRGAGWIISDDGTTLPSDTVLNPGDLWSKTWWALFQLPEFEIMNRQQFDAAINTDDVEYQAEINAAAKESITLDTICGTHKDGVPTARGAYFNTSTGKQVKELTRAGRTTQAEELLIGTLYSQYAQRRTVLTGEAELPTGGLKVFTEQNQGDKLFLAQGEVLDAITDTSEVTLVELRPDEYDKAD